MKTQTIIQTRDQRKTAAKRYARHCLLKAAEYLREALDTLDIENLWSTQDNALEEAEKEIIERAQSLRNQAEGAKQDEAA